MTDIAVSVSCTRGSNGPVERAGGEKRYRACQTLHGKASLRSRESARATSNCVNFRDAKDTRCSRQFNRSGKGRIDAVPVGRHPMNRPGVSEGREVSRDLLGE